MRFRLTVECGSYLYRDWRAPPAQGWRSRRRACARGASDQGADVSTSARAARRMTAGVVDTLALDAHSRPSRKAVTATSARLCSSHSACRVHCTPALQAHGSTIFHLCQAECGAGCPRQGHCCGMPSSHSHPSFQECSRWRRYLSERQTAWGERELLLACRCTGRSARRSPAGWRGRRRRTPAPCPRPSPPLAAATRMPAQEKSTKHLI